MVPPHSTTGRTGSWAMFYWESHSCHRHHLTIPLAFLKPTHGTLGELGTWPTCQAPGQVLYSSDLQIGESHGGGAGANV